MSCNYYIEQQTQTYLFSSLWSRVANVATTDSGGRRSVVVDVTDESNDGIIYEFAFVGTVGEVFDSNLIYPGMHGTFSQSLSLSQ